MTFRSYGHKPWGHYLNIFDAPYTKVKEILIKPGEAPSYQYHHKRSEIWVIVKGTAEVKLDGEVKIYGQGDVIHIPVKSKHQAKNIGDDDLVFIEVQLGEYFGEDDIVRLEDKYGRV